ncbi:MAG: type II toxin-antitoxin system HicA family toxin [Micromonosporaceae bacterium]
MMPKSMKRRDMERALRQHGCVPSAGSGRGRHDKWRCPCGAHSVNVPRHVDLSPGVVGDFMKRMECLPGGWLQ